MLKSIVAWRLKELLILQVKSISVGSNSLWVSYGVSLARSMFDIMRFAQRVQLWYICLCVRFCTLYVCVCVCVRVWHVNNVYCMTIDICTTHMKLLQSHTHTFSIAGNICNWLHSSSSNFLSKCYIHSIEYPKFTSS